MELLRRFVDGDRDAFEALYRQYDREASRWILRIVRDPAAADDALVETFWRAYRGRARFDPARPFGAWLRRIATNAAMDQLKVMAQRPAQHDGEDVAAAPQPDADLRGLSRRDCAEPVGRVEPALSAVQALDTAARVRRAAAAAAGPDDLVPGPGDLSSGTVAAADRPGRDGDLLSRLEVRGGLPDQEMGIA